MQYLEGIDNPDKTPNWKNRALFIVETAKLSGLTLEEVMAMGGNYNPEIKKHIEKIWSNYEKPIA